MSWWARWRLKSPASRLFTQPFVKRRSTTKTLKHRVTGLCEGNLPVISGLPSQRTNNAENVSIWWCHHDHGTNIVCFDSAYFVVGNKYSTKISWRGLFTKFTRIFVKYQIRNPSWFSCQDVWHIKCAATYIHILLTLTFTLCCKLTKSGRHGKSMFYYLNTLDNTRIYWHQPVTVLVISM